MFTGIVESVGSLKSLTKRGNGYEIVVETPESFKITQRVKLGDSIANNGVCLTVTKISGNCFYADVSAETVAHTGFANYARGQKLNLELACTPTTHLGGHIMQGHVDGVGKVIEKNRLDDAIDVWIKAPQELLKYIAHKGSIAVDGISLTVNEINGDVFRLTLIPHTQDAINFTNFEVGSIVNIEVDVLARYLERLLTSKNDESSKKASGITMETLLKNGF